MIDYLIINAHRQHQAYKNPTGDWLGIHYLAAYLNPKGIRTKAFAGYAHEVPILLQDLIRPQQVKVVGLSCDYENQTEVITFARKIKRQWGLPVIVGGPQAFALTQDFFEQSHVDVVICGEGELTSFEVVSKLLKGEDWTTAKGIRYLKDGKVIRNEPRELIQDLDALPFPNPKYALGSLFRPTLASFLTGRGCPFSCSFCYEGGNTKGVRWRSVENVIREVEWVLQERPDIHYIMFTDDTFTVDLKRVRQFCRELTRLRRKHDFTWFCEGHVRTLYHDSTILQEMVDAGMSVLQIGIESGDDHVLDAFNKNITTDMIEQVVTQAYQAGVEQLWGNIILGGACETPQRIEHNIQFCEHLLALAPGMLNMDVVYFWPLPGTAITTTPERFGMKIIDPTSQTSLMDFPVVEYPSISTLDFCNFRFEFMRRLERKMMELLPKVPMSRIVLMTDSQQQNKNFSCWLRAIAAHDYAVKFYHLLRCGAAKLIQDCSPQELHDIHPMRTAAPQRFTPQKLMQIDDLVLSPHETAVMILASGKGTTDQIYQLLQDVGLSWDDFLETFHSLEDKRLILCSKY